MKLIYVDRRLGSEWYPEVRVRHPLSFINPRHVDVPNGAPINKEGTLFEVHEDDAVATADWLAKENPGCEIKVYELTNICVCPPGDLVRKRVTKEGVLPE